MRGDTGLTDTGHDPAAFSMLSSILAIRMAESSVPFFVASNLFADLHDAGFRIVPAALIDGTERA